MSWIKWNKFFHKKNHGGLDIGSLLASNLALLAKWWLLLKIEPNALWCNIIKSFHGNDGGLENSHISSSGVWRRIINVKKDLFKVNIDLPSLFNVRLGMGKILAFGMILTCLSK